MTAAPKPAAAASRLQDNRAAIDEVDSQILALVNRRADLAREIGKIKRAAASKQFDHPAREAEVARRARAAAKSFAPAHAEAIFREIISACFAVEVARRGAFLGPLGTYSHEALQKRFGHGIEAVAAPDIPSVFREVESGRCDLAVAPFENSREGSVGAVLDELVSSSLAVGGEIYVRVRHHLLAAADARLDQIERVYSHPQSLAQCRRWLAARLPEAEHLPCASNAAAAAQAAREPRAAAVAPLAAAEIYGLRPLAADIEDSAANTTRFFIIAPTDSEDPSGDDKTSFVMTAKDEAGAMHRMLEPFARRAVSMTRLESRPARGQMWEYIFFVDIAGHRREENIAAALAEVKARSAFLKILGSYPRETE